MVRIVTKRIVLQMGFSCNARCRFCYYKEALASGKVRDFSTKEVKQKLRSARRFGKDQVELSGGEPTIRKDLFEIAAFARQIGYKTVCIITNGLKTHQIDFIKKLKIAGVNEFLFSIHSPVSHEHDWLTRVNGSYEKVFQSIANCDQMGLSFRTNTVVSNINYNHLAELYKILRPYHPSAANLLVYNPSTAQFPEKGELVDYNVIGDAIKEFIENYEHHFKTINVRWLPFCFLKGYEKNIRTQWQKLYEDQEWDPYFNIKFNKGLIAVILSFMGGLFFYPFIAPIYGKKDIYTRFNEIISSFRMFYFYKQKGPCRECSLRRICTGLHRNYKNNAVFLDRYQGPAIKDPLYFCKMYPQNFESLRINKV